jgi:hypothetical protein
MGLKIKRFLLFFCYSASWRKRSAVGMEAAPVVPPSFQRRPALHGASDFISWT